MQNFFNCTLLKSKEKYHLTTLDYKLFNISIHSIVCIIHIRILIYDHLFMERGILRVHGEEEGLKRERAHKKYIQREEAEAHTTTKKRFERSK